MTADALQKAKRDAIDARRRLDSTLGALQYRLHPSTLASDAWGGVREKSGALADNAVRVARERPVEVTAGVAAAALFVARKPLWRAVSRWLSREPDDEDYVVTRIADQDRAAPPRLAPPIVQRSKDI